MRIVSGEFGSRRLETLKGNNTRPTLDKVREAVFSSLGGFFDGGNFLDLYAGSGAVSLEALSRGCSFAVLNDKSRDAFKVIQANVKTLKVEDRTKVYCMNDMKLLSILETKEMQFDMVYLDPPYAKEKNMKVMKALCDKHLLKDQAIVIVESLKEDEYDDVVEDLEVVKVAHYGISKITYYKKKEVA